MPIWAIYFNPKDYPGKFVLRKWINDIPTDEVYTADSLDEIRMKVPLGLMCIKRYPQDDPVIVETWI
jgi:hypothetical protein